MSHMAGLAALCLLLVFPLSSSQSTLQSDKIKAHQAPAVPHAPPPHVRDFLKQEEAIIFNTKLSNVHLDQDTAKVGLFLAASVGTVTLMAAVYCIYNKFYTKQQYLHTQLNDDTDLNTDPMDSPVYYHASTNSSVADVQRAGYGSLSDSPSIISVPPTLSPPPSAMPFPPLFVSSHSLRTISARDLQKGCI